MEVSLLPGTITSFLGANPHYLSVDAAGFITVAEFVIDGSMLLT